MEIILYHISEPTEYVDFLFSLDSKFGTPNLTRFGDLSNREMMWVITEIVSETNVRNRAKVIKEFIKVYKYISCHVTPSDYPPISNITFEACQILKLYLFNIQYYSLLNIATNKPKTFIQCLP